VASRILYGMGRLRFFARLALVEAALNLGLSLALVGPMGLEGVAIAVAVPNVLFCLFAIGYACLILEVKAIRYLRTAWLSPVTLASVPAAVWWLATPIEPSWTGIAVGIAMGLLPYALLVGLREFGARLAARILHGRTRPSIRLRATRSAEPGSPRERG
jgi:O-antigen/teichoic acid export membrane protein